MKGLTILIVDDSLTMRRMVRRVIELTEVEIAQVHEASNGREALAIIDAHGIDALFTDLNMPEMTGIELLSALKGRTSPRARVIVSTDGSEARRQEAAELNVTCYLEKPLRPEVMRDVLCDLANVPRG
jgi:two-component system chemotaxis response regulator CheY